jgi:hypothetical protein
MKNSFAYLLESNFELGPEDGGRRLKMISNIMICRASIDDSSQSGIFIRGFLQAAHDYINDATYYYRLGF